MGNNYAKAQSIYKVRQKHDKELSKILNAAKGEITFKVLAFFKNTLSSLSLCSENINKIVLLIQNHHSKALELDN